MLAAVRGCVMTAGAATRAEAGLAAAPALVLRAALSDAHPINGTDNNPAAVNPKPCCKNSLRDAIAIP
jgi:hypothetical protein